MKSLSVMITDAPGTQQLPAIYGDKLAWCDYRDRYAQIHSYDLSTGKEERITEVGNEYHIGVDNVLTW